MNPLIAKEVKLGLRQFRATLLQLLFLGSTFFATWMLWPQGGVYSLSAQSSHRLFTVLGLGQLVLVALFAPAFTSPALTMERERNTFDSLYASLLSPMQIVWGKVAGSLMFLILVILSGVPVMSTCLVLGGVGAKAVLWLYVVMLLTGLCFGMMGLLVSSLCRKTYTAVMVTYALIVVFSAVAVLPASLLLNTASSPWRELWHILGSLSPFAAMISIIEPDLLVRCGWRPTAFPAHVLFSGLAVLVSGVCAGVLMFKLRQCPAPRSHAEEESRREGIFKFFQRFPFRLIDPRKRRRMIGPLSNPVLIKELRTMMFGRIQHLMRSAYLCVTVSLLLTLAAAFSFHFFTTRSIAIMTVGLQTVVFLFLVPTLSATLISAEIEGNRFDLLRLTRLSSFGIVSGKFQAVLLPLIILMVATLPPYLVLTAIEPQVEVKLAIVRSAVTMLGMLLFISAAGIFFSSVSRRASFSIGATYAVVVLICVAGLMGLLGYDKISGVTLFSEQVLRALFVINPIVTVLGEVALQEELDGLSLWQPNLGFLLGGSVALLALTVWRVRALIRPE